MKGAAYAVATGLAAPRDTGLAVPARTRGGLNAAGEGLQGIIRS